LGRVLTQLGDYAAAKDRYEQALRVSNEIGDRPLECLLLCSQSLLFHQRGDDQAARTCSRRALLIAQETDEAVHIGNALISLGHALVGLGHLGEAADAYRQALDKRREQEQHNMAMEPLAGLARVSLAQGHLSQAQVWVEEILEHLGAGAPLASDGTSPSGHALDGAEEPFWVYLTCYRVLHTNGDPRAQEVLTAAHDLLQERAAKIEDEELRRSFLENVAANREIVRAWQGAG
jgi:tetratricopeptide (TPR) repeat protein